MKLNEIIKNEEVLSRITELLGENLEEVENLLDGENILNVVPYSRFKEVNDAKKTFETETKNLKTKLTKLSNDENLTPEQWDEKKKEIIKEYDAKIKGIEADFENYKRDSYIKDTLSKNNCKYTDLIISKIDTNKLEKNDKGEYLYLDEQIATLKETYPDMFDTSKNENTNNRNDGIYNNQVKTESNILAEKLGISI
jgi:hypothetical protein